MAKVNLRGLKSLGFFLRRCPTPRSFGERHPRPSVGTCSRVVKNEKKKPPKGLFKNKVRPWVEDKTKAARKLSEHRASRAAARWGGPAGVALIALLVLGSLFFPKTELQKAKEKLAKDPKNLQAALFLAEKFLGNNQFKEAENVLLLAQQNEIQREEVLGEQTNVELEELWERKHYADPEDIRKLISAWEKIMEEKPDYRDGWLQLAFLHYKIYEDEKAKECLQKAIDLDPNYEPAKELEKKLLEGF